MSILTLDEIGARAKAASKVLASLSTAQKNKALLSIAKTLEHNASSILTANVEDVKAARQNGVLGPMIDRLTLTEDRILSIAQAVREVVRLEDPVGKVDSGVRRPNGLEILKTRVPLGVIGIIYEARPNVTVDAAVLCLKSGNACILRGGKEAIHSNLILATLMREAIEKAGVPADSLFLLADTSRETAAKLMKLNQYLDVLIPRGGAGLIRSVLENATVPAIQTGLGNCHVYVDATADLEMAVKILDNAKTSRPSVCNAAETLLVHQSVAEQFLPMAKAALDLHQVELRGCPETCRILGDSVIPATQADYADEFDDYILAVKVVRDLDEAIAHIGRYSTMHSEAIVTNDYRSSQRFTSEVDAAAVYVNASTRFTDGGEFGLGAEIGISTQKLHVRGPMGRGTVQNI